MIRKNRNDRTEPDGHEAKPEEAARPAGVGAAPEEIDSEVSALREELEGLNGKWLRALADLDNYKKRVERDRRRWAGAAREEVLLDLLDVVDNLERALACDGPAVSEDSFRAGVELILKQLAVVLERYGVAIIATDGCEFDPNVHEAVGHVESDGHDSNHIIEETQRGYTLGDRLLRCSKVVVSK